MVNRRFLSIIFSICSFSLTKAMEKSEVVQLKEPLIQTIINERKEINRAYDALNGCTPLQWVVKRNLPKHMIQQIVEAGANVNFIDTSKTNACRLSPLILAIKSCFNKETIQYLVKKGALLYQNIDDARILVTLARPKNKNILTWLLEQKIIDVHWKFSCADYSDLLSAAINQQSVGTVRLLFKYGVKVNRSHKKLAENFDDEEIKRTLEKAYHEQNFNIDVI